MMKFEKKIYIFNVTSAILLGPYLYILINNITKKPNKIHYNKMYYNRVL